MAYIQTIPIVQANDAVREMYQHQQQHWGYLPNYAKVFSHRPEALARWGRLLAELRRPVSDRVFELVTFSAALALKNEACSLAHGKALSKIIGQENVVALAKGEWPKELSDAERAMMNYSRHIALDASSVTADEVTQLKQQHGFSDEELFDIAAIAAGRSFLTKLLDGLGCTPDPALLEWSADLSDACFRPDASG